MPAFKPDVTRFDLWSTAAVADELRSAIGDASAVAAKPYRFIDRAERVARLVELLRRKGGSPGKADMQNVETLRRQLQLIIEQAGVALAMLTEVGAQPAPSLQVVPKRAPMDPIREVQMLAAKYVAEGKSWDMFVDHIDPALMQAAVKQFTEFGPGRSAGRRDPSGFRRHIMDAVPTPEKAKVA
jgi:hypothetical protein